MRDVFELVTNALINPSQSGNGEDMYESRTQEYLLSVEWEESLETGMHVTTFEKWQTPFLYEEEITDANGLRTDICPLEREELHTVEQLLQFSPEMGEEDFPDLSEEPLIQRGDDDTFTFRVLETERLLARRRAERKATLLEFETYRMSVRALDRQIEKLEQDIRTLLALSQELREKAVRVHPSVLGLQLGKSLSKGDA